MTDDARLDLDALERLAAAAAPAPWKRDRNWWLSGRDHVWQFGDDHRPTAGGGHDQLIAQFCGPGAYAVENQDFVMAARVAVPALVAEVRQLRAAEQPPKISAVCIFCEERFDAPGRDAKAAILAHIRVCQWHPMRALERRIALLESASEGSQ